MDLSLSMRRPGWESVSPPAKGLLWLRLFQEISLHSQQRLSLYRVWLLHLSGSAVTDIFISILQKTAPLVSGYKQTHQTCSDSSINSSQGKCKDCYYNSPLLNQLLSVWLLLVQRDFLAVLKAHKEIPNLYFFYPLRINVLAFASMLGECWSTFQYH